MNSRVNAHNDAHTMEQATGLLNGRHIVREQLLQNKVVGLGEAHWFTSVFEYWQQLVLNDDILEVCQDIVLEAGNQGFQQDVTDYINGSDRVSELHIHNMFMASIVFPVWMAPCYLNFFKAVRVCNQTRKQSGKPLVRLHVMEPKFVWRDVHSKIDYLKINGARDEAFFRYVEQHFITHNKPVMAIMGARHLLSITPMFKPKNFAQFCHKHYPNRLFSIWPHIFNQPLLDALQENIVHDSQAGLVLTSSALLRDIDFSELCPMPQMGNNKSPLSQQVQACLLVKNATRHIQWDTSRLNSVDVYDMLHRAQYLNDKQQQLIQRMIQG